MKDLELALLPQEEKKEPPQPPHSSVYLFPASMALLYCGAFAWLAFENRGVMVTMPNTNTTIPFTDYVFPLWAMPALVWLISAPTPSFGPCFRYDLTKDAHAKLGHRLASAISLTLTEHLYAIKMGHPNRPGAFVLFTNLGVAFMASVQADCFEQLFQLAENDQREQQKKEDLLRGAACMTFLGLMWSASKCIAYVMWYVAAETKTTCQLQLLLLVCMWSLFLAGVPDFCSMRSAYWVFETEEEREKDFLKRERIDTVVSGALWTFGFVLGATQHALHLEC